MDKHITFTASHKDISLFTYFIANYYGQYKRTLKDRLFHLIIQFLPVLFIAALIINGTLSAFQIIAALLLLFIYIFWFWQFPIYNKKRMEKFHKLLFSEDSEGYDVTLHIHDTGISSSSYFQEETYNWKGILDVREFRDYIIILLKHGRGFMVPRNKIDFDIDQLTGYIKSKIGK